MLEHPKIRPRQFDPVLALIEWRGRVCTQRGIPKMKDVTLPAEEVLYRPGARISHIYFPTTAVLCMLTTMYDGRTNLAAQVASEVRQHFPDQVLSAVVPRSVRISEAPSYQQTVMTYDPSSSGALSYMEAAAEIAER